MLTRTLSTLVLAPLFLAATWAGFPYFDITVASMGLIAAAELLLITCRSNLNLLAYIALMGFAIGTAFGSLSEYHLALTIFIFGGIFAILSTTRNLKNILWVGFGYFYVAIAPISLIEIRGIPDIGRQTVFWFFTVIWANDIGAYLVGRMVGGARLAPFISPRKTWAGTLGGLLFAVMASIAFLGSITVKQGIVSFILFGFLLAVAAQIGDLLESYFKRYYGVKDSGALIPGHGGILDRADSVLFSAPITLLVLLYFCDGTCL